MAAESKTGHCDRHGADADTRDEPVIAPHWSSSGRLRTRFSKRAKRFQKAWFARRHEATRNGARRRPRDERGGRRPPAAAMRTLAQWQQGSLSTPGRRFPASGSLSAPAATGRVDRRGKIEAAQESAENVGKRSEVERRGEARNSGVTITTPRNRARRTPTGPMLKWSAEDAADACAEPDRNRKRHRVFTKATWRNGLDQHRSTTKTGTWILVRASES